MHFPLVSYYSRFVHLTFWARFNFNAWMDVYELDLKLPLMPIFWALSFPFDSPTGATWNRCLRACKLGQVQHQKALQRKEPTRMCDLRLLRTVTLEGWKSKRHSESSARMLFSFLSSDLWKFHFLSSAYKTISCQQAFGSVTWLGSNVCDTGSFKLAGTKTSQNGHHFLKL
jgi:hypothetical protein